MGSVAEVHVSLDLHCEVTLHLASGGGGSGDSLRQRRECTCIDVPQIEGPGKLTCVVHACIYSL